MNKLLIGSQAIKVWFPDFPRTPKDRDYAVESKAFAVSAWEEGIEYLYNPVLFKYVGEKESILSADLLYTLKISHMAWDIQWEKHIFDIQWLKAKGCKLVEPLFWDLYSFWKEYHGEKKRSNLEMNAQDFFSNVVDCPHDHDYLHSLLVNPPTYTKILKNGAEVEVCQEKFNSLSFEEKCSLVREEIYIMSWERWPHSHYRKAYGMMLKKFIQGHAPLWEMLFILDNYSQVSKPEFNHFNKLENAVRLNNHQPSII